MSSSLLTRINELALKKGEEDPLAEEDDIMPGTSMLAPPSARQVCGVTPCVPSLSPLIASGAAMPTRHAPEAPSPQRID